MKKSYCTQNNGDCSSCSLVNYNRDCQNNPIATKDNYIHIRINSDLKQQAQQHAAETGRTLAGLIEWLLKQELKNNGIAANRQEGRKIMKTLTEWKEEMMEEVVGTVEISCIMEEVPHHPGTKRFQIYNQEGTYDKLFDITLDADENIINIE
jgi:antitoxin component of RelBE/YafQ-DinJ toxin-antitoxin module